MRTLAEILITIVLTLALILGASLLLGGPAPSGETPTEPTIQTLPAETAPVTAPAETAETTEAEQAPMVTAMPRYYQTDYPYDKFGNGTISTSGCSITCLAMVATYLTGQEYFPDEMAYHFGRYGKNNIERLEYGNAQMQLPNVRTDNVRDVLTALDDSKVVIAMMDDESIFTTTQHFIVLAGMAENGKILVHDPLEKAHPTDAYLRNGYDQGFGTHDILRGFSGAWIYDKAEMPEEPFLFDAKKPVQEENRYEGYTLTDEDNYILASFLWAEARKEPEETQQAIAEVILNRLMNPDFPNTVSEIISRGEFSGKKDQMQKARVDFPQYRAVTAAMYGPYVLPEDVYYFSVWETGGDVWGKLGSYTFLRSR